MNPKEPVTPTPLEILGIIALCFGWIIAGSLAALASNAPDGEITDAAIMNLLLFELVIGGIALLVLKARGHAIAELLPLPTLKGCMIGFVLYTGYRLAHVAVVLPWTPHLSQPVAEAAQHAASAIPPSTLAVFLLCLANSVYEEVFALGYLVRGLGKYGGSIALGASCLLRVLCRLDQGPLEALAIVLFGVMSGIYYWRTRDLWPVIFAHTLIDVLPFVLPD